MKSANEIKAEAVMNENPVTASSDQSLSQVKNRMEDEDIRAIPVVSEKEKLEGVIGYRDLIRFLQFNPSKTKLSKVMHQPPEFDTSDSLVDLADLRINSGRKLLVHTKGGKLKGVVADQEFLEAFNDTEELEDLKTARFAENDLLTVFEKDNIEVARHRMLDNNVSRLPVKDDSGNLTGILKSTDLLKAMVPREAPHSGGAAGDRNGNEVYIAGGDEKEAVNQVSVEELMERMVTTSEEYLDGKEAIELMLEQESHEIIKVDDKYPEAILTVKDFIDHVESLKPSNTVLVNLVGLEVPEEKAALHDKIRNQLRGSLGRKLEQPEELSVHVKKAEKDGTKHRYELNVKLHSEFGVTHVEEEGWELLDALDTALEELNTQVRKQKEKRDDRRKQ
ncbi:MAG: CBS domain-containing protein [Candidatus Nanosalina sp.]